MLYGMYVSAAGAMANDYRQDVLANNLANADTIGFKKDLALLRGRPTEVQANGQPVDSSKLLEGLGGGLFALPTYTDFSPASIESTDNEYDLALMDKGFFQVSNGEDTLYTRDGRMTLDENYQLVTVSGHLPYLDESGQPIVINPALGKIHVTEHGHVVQGNEVVGRFGIVDFDDPQSLKKAGQNLFAFDGPGSAKMITAMVKQGALEKSSVDPISELTEMIKTSRLLQDNISMIKLQDQTLGLAVSKVGSVSV